MRRPSKRVFAELLALYGKGELSRELTHYFRHDLRILPPVSPLSEAGGSSFSDRYPVFVNRQRAILEGGLTTESARSRSRREVARLESFETVGKVRGWKARGKNLESPHVLFAWLGIAELCAVEGRQLLTKEEFTQVLAALEKSYGLPFDAPGLMRSRWLWWSGTELSRIRVDLRKNFAADGFVAELENDLEKLLGRAPGWEKLLSDGALSFSIVTPKSEREALIQKAAGRVGFPIPVRVTAIPWLKLAWGEAK